MSGETRMDNPQSYTDRMCLCLDWNGVLRLGYLISILGFLINAAMLFVFLQSVDRVYEDYTAYDLFMYLCCGMSILFLFLIMGLAKQQLIYFYAWLVMSIVTIVVGSICLIFFKKQNLIIVSSAVLALTILSWYPIFFIFQKYRTTSTAQGQQQILEARPEVYISTPPSAPTAPYLPTPEAGNTETKGEGLPPSYDEVMGSNTSRSPEVGIVEPTPVGWNIAQI